MQTLKPTKKQKILTEAVKKLDSNFELVVIDNELCLYKRSADDKFDVEVSGTIGYLRHCNVYLWRRSGGWRIVKSVYKVNKEPVTIVNLVNELLDKADELLVKMNKSSKFLTPYILQC